MKSKKSHAEWKTLVSEFNKSGLSMTGFSKENNLKPSTFIYWVKMFSRDIENPKMIKLEPKVLTPMTTNNVKVVIGDIKIELSGNITSNKISKIISVLMEVS